VPGLTLSLAGAGPLEGELRAAAPDGVTLLGHAGDVPRLLEEHAIVIVPSRGEGFGMVALEAAERGRAAIVSDVGGLPEIVGDTGVVVPPGNEEALAAAIVELASDPGRVQALGTAARVRAVAQFSADDAAAGVERVYRDLLQSRSTAHAASSTSRKSNGTR
jgi:glycosyltransferase involved in cell wall biosynthesis